jgi:hypothetical protein
MTTAVGETALVGVKVGLGVLVGVGVGWGRATAPHPITTKVRKTYPTKIFRNMKFTSCGATVPPVAQQCRLCHNSGAFWNRQALSNHTPKAVSAQLSLQPKVQPG